MACLAAGAAVVTKDDVGKCARPCRTDQQRPV